MTSRLYLPRREFLAAGGAMLAAPLIAGAMRPRTDLLAPLREQAVRHVAEGRVPSLSIAVFQHGRPLWVEAFGLADRERAIPATTATTYAIASASKPFLGSLVAGSILAGRMSLDAPIGHWVSGLGADVAEVTVRELLQHRSGVPRHWRNFFVGQGQPPPFAEVARDHVFTTAARGRRYLYSNLNYGLLATAVERLEGGLQQRLREEIFAPLGLTSAGVLSDQYADWTAATPYEDDGAPIPPYLVDEAGARDLVMTAGDLARFGVAHLEGRLGPASALMIADRAEIDWSWPGRASYGLGWIIDEDSPASLFTYGHTGEGPGAAASLAIVPDEQLVVATVANAQGAPTYMLNEAIVDAISPRFAERRNAHPWVDPEPDAHALKRLEGRWRGRLDPSAGGHAVVLIIGGAGSMLIVGDEPATAVSRLGVTAGVLSGRAEMSLPMEGARRWPHGTRLLLDVDGSALDGSIAAYAPRGEIPHEQFWLSYRLRLERHPA